MKQLIYFLSILFLLPLSLLGQDVQETNTTTPRTKIAKGNWPSEYMGTHKPFLADFLAGCRFTLSPPFKVECTGSSAGIGFSEPCIQTNGRGDIQIKLSFTINGTSTGSCSPIRLKYTIGNSSGILRMESMAASTTNNKTTYSKTVRASVKTGQNTSFSYRFEILDDQNQLYPVDQCPGLFVTYEDFGSSGILNIPSDDPITVLSGTKALCNPDIKEVPRIIDNDPDVSANTESRSFFAEETINVYPNPFTDELKLTTDNITGHVSVDLFNLNGQLVYSTTINGSMTTAVNTSILAKGIYFCHIKTSTHQKVIKLSKQ